MTQDDPTQGPTGDALLESLVAECLRRVEEHGDGAVDEMCAENPLHAEQLRDQVERIIAIQMLRDCSPELPESIGPYKVLGSLGEGGMGMVLLAEQRKPVRRRVAIKVIKLGMDTRAVLSRFELEKQALAVMDHPAIAKVFDADATDQGQPYFVMEFVEGTALNNYCDEHGLPIPARIQIVQQICRGVQHAHQKGVLHRDLKPANILISKRQDQHVVKIIDFGLARATHHQLVENTIFTEHGQLLGTPEYMSPEQAGGSALEIDTRTDIYSLGVILYELLSGALPLPSDKLRSRGGASVQQMLRDHHPPKPSARVSDLATDSDLSHRRGHTTLSLRKSLRGDLDWIVMKAIAKEPDRRYSSATELMQDLERYLNHEPVLAGPPSASYRLGKLIEKHRIEFVSGVIVFVALLVGAISSTWALLDAKESERVALDQITIAEKEIARFDQLALTVRMDEAVEELRELIKSGADQQAIGEWIVSAEELSTQLQTALTELKEQTSRSEDPTDSDAAIRNRFVLSTLLRAGKDVAEFIAPNGPVAQARMRQSWLIERSRIAEQAEIAGRWARARDALRLADGVGASTLYSAKHHPSHPINLRPQAGLVPIGMNPKTRLLEFYHLRSAWGPGGEQPAVPVHDDQGRIKVTANTGIIFVLVPGGTAQIGAQGRGPDEPNFDKSATKKGRPKKIPTAPFFLARHEMTQGQWLRLCSTTPLLQPEGINRERWLALSAGENPSRYPNPLHHPVEMVSWHMATELTEYFGLRLPTPNEWEYASRAGKDTPWHTGSSGESLFGYANVYDQTATKILEGTRAAFKDGFENHSPVGAMKPNSFGFHDVHGNVWELCSTLNKAGDCVYRGGSSAASPFFARFGYRRSNAPTLRHSLIAFRPARSLDIPR